MPIVIGYEYGNKEAERELIDSFEESMRYLKRMKERRERERREKRRLERERIRKRELLMFSDENVFNNTNDKIVLTSKDGGITILIGLLT